MTPEVEAISALGTLVNAVGLPLVALVVIFAMYKYERIQVAGLEQKRIDDHLRFIIEMKLQNQQRIDDLKSWMQIILSVPQISSRTPTNLSP